ncbi:MAG: metallophosphoesterase [Lentisphaeraceae bacterium]|nr:metallophosphoesterase [Lentisphaeraceae bacterium]
MSIRFGIVSDPQFSDIDDMKGRQYRKTLEKLDFAIDELNSHDLDFVIQLGDMIDHEFESFEPVLNVWSKLKHKSYHVLGNHDFCVQTPFKDQVLKTLNLSSSYFSFKIGQFNFCVLNGNGLSLNAFDAESEMYIKSEKYWEEFGGESQWWNGAVDPEQALWFKNELEIADKAGLKSIIFCHYPLIGEARYNLWNSKEILELIESYKSVKVWMNGHFHAGGYKEHKLIHHVNIKGMVQCKEPTFAIAEICENELAIKGYGEEESRILKI